MVGNFPNFTEDISLDLRSWSNTKQDKPKQIYAQEHNNLTLEKKDQDKSWKQLEKTWLIACKGATIWMTADFSNAERKVLSKQNSISVKISFRNVGET